MDESQSAKSGGAEHGWVDVATRFFLAVLVVYWSFILLRPFIAILVWSAILSVALHPFHSWLNRLLGGRATLASFLLTVAALVVILGPVSSLGAALVRNLSSIAAGISAGTIVVPPPPPGVADWPLVGDRLSALWLDASEELGETLATLEPQLAAIARKLLALVGNVGLGVLQFTVGIIIAGFTYSRAADIEEFFKKFATRAAPQMGAGFVDLAGGTVRGVARGVVGVSLIQAILFGLGVMVAEIPFAGLWTFIVLTLAIVQVGPSLVVLFVIIYAWATMDTFSAALLTAYLVPVNFLDNVLKPIVMSLGLPVPMLVIFIGVIGGTLAHGLIGLFVGPIVLSLGYELAKAWVTVGR